MAYALKPLALITGNSNPALAQEVSRLLKTPLTRCSLTKFADGEISVNIFESVRGKHVFLIQSLCHPVNDNLMELLLLMDGLHRASAEVTVVIPYYAYARQDQKYGPREPIAAKLVAKLIETAVCSRVVSLDLHSGQIQGFFDKPVDHLNTIVLFKNHFKKTFGKNLKPSDVVVVSPDAGGAKRARKFASAIGASLAIVNKHRPNPNESAVTHIVGKVSGKTAVLYDDLIDTGGSIANAAQTLIDNGAKQVYAYCTHALLSKNAIEKLEASPLTKLIVTNSIPLKRASKKIEVVSIAPMLASAIYAIYHDKSVSELLTFKPQETLLV